MEGINYNGCKVATFICNTDECEDIEEYEKAVNEFLTKSNIYIVNVIPTVSNYLLVMNIFYRENRHNTGVIPILEVKNG